MSAALRRAAGLVILVSIVMILCLSVIITGYVRKTGLSKVVDNWLIMLLPVLPPLVTVTSWAAARWFSRHYTLVRGFILGIFVVSSAYSLIPLVYLSSQYRLISRDGTAYWGLLAIPAFWLWLPAASIGGVAGTIIAAIRPGYRGVRNSDD